MNNILERINSPADLRKLSGDELNQLTGEIREYLVKTVAENGGHLAPNLGVVELTLALHCAFNTPHDKIVWDVGHQTYTHKLVTGRRKGLDKLRQHDGCSGFPTPGESEYDCFTSGHAGNAISAASGIKAAFDRQGKNEQVVAVVGDGAFNCGISLEGLNNANYSCRGLIVILNDNKMSISANVGAMARHFNRLISGGRYIRFRSSVRDWIFRFRRGRAIHRFASKVLRVIKNTILPGSIFETMGFRYLGPINGHDINAMIRVFNAAKGSAKPVLIHVITEKGRGYKPAVAAPEKFHGIAPFDPVTGEGQICGEITFSKVFGEAMLEMAERHPELVAITAGMAYGTGLSEFSRKFPKRFFDVGIAEGHAAVFAGGLAVGGMRPVYAVYATFIQRALDNLFHDVCLQNLPVIFAVDRAGIVEDGCTHHGIHDLGFMRTMPNLTIMAPCDKNELKMMLDYAYELASPVVIRYPRGSAEPCGQFELPPLMKGKAAVIREGEEVAIWAWGREVETAWLAAEALSKEGIQAAVVDVRFLKPFDSELLKKHAAVMPVITLEDGQTGGGLAAQCDEILINGKHHGIVHFGWGDQIIEHGSLSVLREKNGFSITNIVNTIKELKK